MLESILTFLFLMAVVVGFLFVPLRRVKRVRVVNGRETMSSAARYLASDDEIIEAMIGRMSADRAEALTLLGKSMRRGR